MAKHSTRAQSKHTTTNSSTPTQRVSRNPGPSSRATLASNATPSRARAQQQSSTERKAVDSSARYSINHPMHKSEKDLREDQINFEKAAEGNPWLRELRNSNLGKNWQITSSRRGDINKGRSKSPTSSRGDVTDQRRSRAANQEGASHQRSSSRNQARDGRSRSRAAAQQCSSSGSRSGNQRDGRSRSRQAPRESSSTRMAAQRSSSTANRGESSRRSRSQGGGRSRSRLAQSSSSGTRSHNQREARSSSRHQGSSRPRDRSSSRNQESSRDRSRNGRFRSRPAAQRSSSTRSRSSNQQEASRWRSSSRNQANSRPRDRSFSRNQARDARSRSRPEAAEQSSSSTSRPDNQQEASRRRSRSRHQAESRPREAHSRGDPRDESARRQSRSTNRGGRDNGVRFEVTTRSRSRANLDQGRDSRPSSRPRSSSRPRHSSSRPSGSSSQAPSQLAQAAPSPNPPVRGRGRPRKTIRASEEQLPEIIPVSLPDRLLNEATINSVINAAPSTSSQPNQEVADQPTSSGGPPRPATPPPIAAPKAEIPAPRNAPARSPTPPPALEAAPADQARFPSPLLALPRLESPAPSSGRHSPSPSPQPPNSDARLTAGPSTSLSNGVHQASRSPTPEPSTSNSATVKPPTSQDVRQSRRSSPSPSPASDTNLTSEPSTSQVNGVVAESQSPAPSEAATPEELNGQAVNGVVGEIPEEPASPAPIEDRNPQVDEIDMEEEPLAIEVDERQDADGEDRDESRPQSAVVSEGDLLSDISISEFSEDDEDVDFARLSPISLDDGVAEGAEAPEVLEDQEAPAENPEAVEEDPEPLGDRSPEEIKEFQVAFEQQFYDDIPYHGDNLELAPKVREVENRDDVEDDAPRSPDAPSNSGTSNGPTPSPSPSNMDQGDADQNGGNMEEGQEDDREPDVTPEPSRDNEEPSSSQPLSAADSPAPSDDSAHEARKTSLGALEDSMMEPAQPAIHQPTKTETVSIEANNALQSTSKTPSTDQMEQVPSISYKTAQYAPEKSAILEDQAPTPEVFASPEASASPEVHAAAPGPQKRGAPESPVSEPPAKRARVEPEEKGCQTEEEIQKVDDLYKPEEKLDASTKEKTLLGVDLEELVRKRVEMHSENFRHVCLPFNHSLDFKSWTQEEVLEMASQFMGAVEVEGLRLAECDGKIIWDLTKEELFLKLNETRAIISWRALEKFIEMLVQLETGLARNAAGYFQASSYRPSTPTVKIFKDIGIQVDPIETMVDKRNTDEVYVEVGGKRLEEMDLSDDRVKLLNSAFDSVALPFDHSYMNENWTHQQVVEVVAQLLPHAAAHAIESLEEIEGPSLCRFNAETLEGKELFKNLNFHSANISTVDFLKVNEHFKTVFAARGIYLKRLEEERQGAGNQEAGNQEAGNQEAEREGN